MAACGGGGGDDSAATEIAFTVQPADVQAVDGSAAVFTTTVRGEADLQWQRMEPAGWVNIAGATGARYSLVVVSAADQGAQFRVQATSRADRANQVMSSVVTLTVATAPVALTITVQPSDQSVIEGQQVALNVTVLGTSPAYQWQRSNDGANWADVVGATAPTLVFPSTPADHQRAFRVVVVNAVGTVTSATAHVMVTAAGAPIFVANPTAMSAFTGQSVTFNASAAGTPAPTIRWQVSTDSGTTWADIAGANGDSVTIAAATASDDGRLVRAVATNTHGDVFSAAARLSVLPGLTPAIQIQPEDRTVGQGTQASFHVSARGVPTPTYQWQVSTDGGITFANVNGATQASLSLAAATPADDGKRLRVVVTNSEGSVTSAAARLRIYDAPRITLQPMSSTWRPGQRDALFTTAASGNSPQYQWQLSSDAGVSWVDAPGATGTSYVHGAAASAAVNYVRVVARNELGEAISNSAYLEALKWETVAPRPFGGTLLGLAWRDATTVLATGTQGSILRSTDAGASWSIVSESSPASRYLPGIAFDGNGVGVTASYAGSGNGNYPIKRSVDGGLHWVEVLMPVTTGLNTVAFSNTGAFCVAGNNGTILRSTDAGQTWVAAVSDGGPVALHGMAFNADGVGLAVGASGTVLRTINGGANWTRVASGAGTLAAVAFATRDIAFAGGSNGTLLRSRDAGQTWQTVASGTTQDINSIHFGSATAGALGLTQGGVRMTFDGGTSWAAAALSPSGVTVHAVRFGANGQAVAVGELGSIFRSADNGQGWSTVSPGGNFGQSLMGVAFATPTHGVAVGIGGHLLRSTDAGLNWTATASGTTEQLNAVGFFDTTTGVAMGANGTIVRTADAGASWSAVSSGTPNTFQAFAPVTGTTGVASSTSGLWRTTDAGASWTPAAGAAFSARSLAFSALTGLAVGDAGEVRRSTDGGQLWTAVSSGTTESIRAVTFVTPSRVVAVGTNGIVLRSDDAGATWQVDRFPVFWDYGFYGVSFTSPTTGFAVGNYGTVMATRDGGANWFVSYSPQSGNTTAIARAGSQAVVTVGGGGIVMRNDAP
ncbi:hypothetical protein ASF44_23870 [Pseudorhodoferax sp. Leaf274]|nr:hypothetical protein ASF44_23870 [Pseudorhodoferax sp. Leaf274]